MSLQNMLDTDDGVLSPEDATALLDRAMNGETIEFDEPQAAEPTVESSEPPVTTDSKDSQVADEQLNADNAVIMAKDGKHTIPFEKLQQARESERLALQQAEQANAELEKLRSQQSQSNTAAQQAKIDNQIDIAQQAIDNGVDPSIFGDFDEEGLTNGIQTLVQQQVAQQVEARLKQALEPIAQKQQIDETQQHYAAILQAHPDIESVAESQEFASWRASQPSYAQQAINGVLSQGTTDQVIELFNQFKGNAQTAAPTPADIKQAAKAKLDNAQSAIPASLSDIAGGQAHTSPDEQLANLDGVDMLAAMEKMSPEQIERILNKTL